MKKKPEKESDITGESLISQAKAAELCGVTRAAIHALVERRRFRSLEVEGRDLVYLKEVEAFAREGRQALMREAAAGRPSRV
jgi:hypothetical protein